jgi:hypothetical protein
MSVKETKINLKENMCLVDFANVFLREFGRPDLCGLTPAGKSRISLIILESLGFYERMRGKGNYTYVHVGLSDVNELSITLSKNQPIGALTTLEKIKEWNNQNGTQKNE